jgi:hypothetical protein
MWKKIIDDNNISVNILKIRCVNINNSHLHKIYTSYIQPLTLKHTTMLSVKPQVEGSFQ